MKIPITIPIAVAATLTFPRGEEPTRGNEEISILEKTLAQKDAMAKQISALKDRQAKGEKISVPSGRLQEPAVVTGEDLQKARQEISSLQQEFEQIQAQLEEMGQQIELTPPPAKVEDLVQTNEGVKTDPFRLGQSLFRIGKYQEAMKALSRTENDPEASLLAAACLEKMGKPEEAVVAYKKITELYPDTPAAKQAVRVQGFIERRVKLGVNSDYEKIVADLQKNSATPETPKAEEKK